ncbi:hypothetical protein HC891_10060, partial [Candidatus Gracilibacteria bacterium]|nr:hypothetical protein [Candidatus Gracilibacteria bacterium]
MQYRPLRLLAFRLLISCRAPEDSASSVAAPANTVLAQQSDPDTPISEGKPATAHDTSYSEYPPGEFYYFEPRYANDGDIDTHWLGEGLPGWWRVDFENTYTITKVIVDWGFTTISMSYTLSVSDNGVDFTDLVTRNNATVNDAKQTSDKVQGVGRYLRVTVTGGLSDGEGIYEIDKAAIIELRAYGMPTVPDDQLNPPERCPVCQDQTQHPVNTHTGAFWTSHTDLQLASPGPALAWGRTYNSRNITATSILGPGWQHPYAARLLTDTMPGGEDDLVVIVTPKGNRFRFADNGDGTFTTYPGIYDALVRANGVYTQTLRDQSQYVFNATTGALTSIRDPQGRTLTLSYDASDGRLLQIADTLAPQRKLVLSYNAARDRITGVSDGSRTFSYGYDALGDLVSVTDTMSRTTTYRYNEHGDLADHLLTSIINPLGQVVEQMNYRLQMDAWRVTYQRLQDGQQLSFDYSAEQTTITTRSASDVLIEEQVFRYGPDSTKAGEAINGVTVAASDYDATFAPGTVRDGNGNTTTTAFNSFGQPRRITDALGQTTAAEYDALQRPVVITDTMGRRTTMAYDAANNLVRQTTDITGTFAGFTTIYTSNLRYPGQHWLEDTVSPDGVRTRYEYDALGQRTAVTINYVDGSYDQATPDADLRTTYGYDTFGRVVTTTVGVGSPLERADVTQYNADDTIAATIPNYRDGVFTAAAPDEDLITRYGYDKLGRQVWVQDALGRYDVTHYATDGRVDWTAQNLVPFQRDSNDLPVFQPFDRSAPAQNIATLYGYDALGRTTHVTQTGILTGTFDPTTEQFSAATTRTTYTEYDTLSRPITVTLNYQPGVAAGPDVNVQTTRTYTTNGNLIWERDALGRWTYTEYDALNRPITVTLNYENGDPLTVDAVNASWAMITDTDHIQVTRYRPDGRVERVIDGYVDGVYSAAEPDRDRVTVFGYDALGRQVQVTRTYVDGNPATGSSDTDVISRTHYDAVGRVQASEDALGRFSSLVYDAASRVVQTIQNCRTSSGAAVTTNCAAFDPLLPDRNVPSATRYDALGRGFEMEDALGYVTQSSYDGVGRTLATTRNYIAGGPSDSDTNVTTQQAYDALGRVLATTDATDVTTNASYDALGRTISSTDAENRTRRMATTGRARCAGRRHRMAATACCWSMAWAAGRRRSSTTRMAWSARTSQPTKICAPPRSTIWPGGGWRRWMPPGARRALLRPARQPGASDRERRRWCLHSRPLQRRHPLHLRPHGQPGQHHRRNGHMRRMGYDAADRQIRSTDALNQVTQYAYDRAGRLTATDDPRGAVYDVSYAYDALDRPIGMDASELTAPISMGYNALGWRTTLTDGSGTTTFDHDALGRTAIITAPVTGVVGYGYNARGERTQLRYPDGSAITYAYWGDGQLKTVQQGASTLASYRYDNVGRLDTVTRGNGATQRVCVGQR